MKAVPGVLRLVRAARAFRDGLRASVLRGVYGDGCFFRCGEIDVYGDLHDPTHLWYVGESINLSIDRQVLTALVARSGASVFLDIGAHFGFYGALLAKIARDAGRSDPLIVAVEPNPRAFHALERTMSRAAPTRCRLVRAAVGDRVGKARMHEVQGAPCHHSYASSGLTGSYEVDALTIDEIVERFVPPDEAVGLIKIDVDGAESEVLRGAVRTLEKFQPIVMIEFSPEQLVAAGADAPGFLSDLLRRFDVYWLRYSPAGIERVREGDFTRLAVASAGRVTELILLPSGASPALLPEALKAS